MSSPRLDHIIILISYASLFSLPAYFTDNFTITPGGRHADNKTENKLICFQDGSYIELIAFINDDPANRIGHWWGEKKFGIIDFAFTHTDGDTAVHFSELEERLEAMNLEAEADKVKYQPPIADEKTRPEGVDVKRSLFLWLVRSTREASFHLGATTLLFVKCAPFTKACTTHPCGSTEVTELYVVVPEERVSVLLEAYGAILAASVKDSFVEVDKLKDINDSKAKTRFVVAAPTSEIQGKAMEERGGCLLANLDLSGEKKKMRIDGPEDEFGIGGLYI